MAEAVQTRDLSLLESTKRWLKTQVTKLLIMASLAVPASTDVKPPEVPANICPPAPGTGKPPENLE